MVDKLFRASEVVVMALKEIEKLFHVSEVVMIESSSLALSSAPYAKFRGHALYARVYMCVCMLCGGDTLYARGLIS